MLICFPAHAGYPVPRALSGTGWIFGRGIKRDFPAQKPPAGNGFAASADCRGDLAQLKTALAAGEYEKARRLGHQMKGTGKPYGFPALTQIGRANEWAASKQAASELESRIQRLEACLNSIELTDEGD